MQRISDHVANGAYLYAKIDWKEYEDWINGEKKTIFNNVSGLIEKLTERYHLELSPRQRNYRLEKGFPICTAIVQRDLLININGRFIYCLLHLEHETLICSVV